MMVYFSVCIFLGMLAVSAVSLCILWKLSTRVSRLQRKIEGGLSELLKSDPLYVCTAAGLEACRVSEAIIDRESEKLRRALSFYKCIEGTMPEDARWNLKREVSGPFSTDITPSDFRLPSEIVEERLEIMAAMRIKYHGSDRHVERNPGEKGDSKQQLGQDVGRSALARSEGHESGRSDATPACKGPTR